VVALHFFLFIYLPKCLDQIEVLKVIRKCAFGEKRRVVGHITTNTFINCRGVQELQRKK